MLTCKWISLGAGRLTLWHYLGRDSLAALREFGVTRVVTLLTEDQGALKIGEQVQQLGIAWMWISIRSGKRPQGEAERLLLDALPVVSKQLEDGESVLVHCSAGQHRTGMFAYALLRSRGYSRDDALDLIGTMRKETRAGLQERHLQWGDRVVEKPTADC